MAATDFPNSPTVNQTFTVGERTWKWTGTTWDVVVTTQIVGPVGPKGDTGFTGPPGVTDVTSPITNSGSSTSANIGINQSLLSLSKSQVGLNNVDNTSDIDKPVSTATQTALNLKAASSHIHGNITNSGAIGSVSGLVAVTTASGVLTVTSAPTSAATQFLKGDLTWDVPVDTNYYPTAVTIDAGTTAGPAIGLTMNIGTMPSTVIPAAATGASGVVTTGPQNFDGIKTFNSFPQVASGLPSNSLDLVNKQYVDNIASGINAHDAVVAATTAALTATYNNNTTGIGATLTNSGTQAALVIDNVTLNVGDRVLVKNQGTTLQNGIYYIKNSGDQGSASTNWVLTRTSDYDQSIAGEVQAGDTTFVVAPTAQYSVAPTNNNTSWTMNSPETISIGSSAITFVQTNASSGYAAGTGIDISTGTISVNSTVLTTTSTQTGITNKTFTAPVLGAATATTINKVTITPPATASTLTVDEGKTFRASNTMTLSSSGDGNNLNIGTGGTLATGAFATIANYAALGSANAFTVGGHVVTSESTTVKPLTLKVAASQTADQIQYQSSGSTVLGGRNATGKIYSGSTAPLSVGTTTFTYGAVLSATSPGGTTATITVSGSVQPFTASGQTVTLTNISGGNYNQVVTVSNPQTVVSGSQYSFTATGSGFTTVAGTGGNFVISPSGTGATATINLLNNPAMSVGDLVSVTGFTGVTAYNTGTGVFVPVTAVSTTLPYSISYASGASGTAAGTPSISVQAQVSITTSSNLTSGILVRNAGTAGSGYLQQWQSSVGGNLLYVDTSGIMVGSGIWRTSSAMALGSSSTTTMLSNASMGHLVLQNTLIQPNNTATGASGGGVIFVDSGALKYRGPTGSAATIVNSDGTLASFTGGTLTSGLTLAAGTSTPLIPLTFTTNASTPTAVSGGMDYDGTVFYQTSNTSPGRALNTQGYYYASSADYIVDFSGSGAVQSVLGAATRGITVAAGTTYEYELSMAVQHQWVVETGITGTFQLTSTTVTLSPTVAHVSYVDYGSNTTGFTTATTMSSVRTTGTVTFSATISTGSRYNIVRVKGIIRVTGTGTVKIYPGLLTSGTNQNTWTVQSGLSFRMTPIGNGTVTTVGTWA